MRHKTNHLTHGGFTLIELIVSMTAASFLMVGLSSTLFIAFRATDTSNSPATNTLAGLARLSEMAAELQYTQTVLEQTANAITVTVPDRNDPDTNPELIRYAWSGTIADPLTRQYNGGITDNVVENVHNFEIQYYQPAAVIKYITVSIQVASDSQTRVETSIPLLNQP